MKAIIFADRLGKELEPLTDNTCVALLPVVGKPVIEHTLEDLVKAGIREAVVVLSPHADQVEKTLGNGERWGMQLDYLLTRGDASPVDVVKRLKKDLGKEFLAIRGDMLRSEVVKEFLEKARDKTGDAIFAYIAGGPSGICLCRNQSDGLELLRWGQMGVLQLDLLRRGERQGNARVAYLNSLKAFHQANMDAIAGDYGGLIMSGREIAPGVVVGRHSTISPGIEKEGRVFVGNGSRVDPEVKMRGNVVISNNVIVDRKTSLDSCLILPDTYVGEMVDVRNAIVQGRTIIRIDTGARMNIVDRFLAADLKSESASNALGDIANRLSGLLLFLFSLPLWSVAAATSVFANPSSPLTKVRLYGNQAARLKEAQEADLAFSAWQWATPVPLLRYLPMLLNVMAGHLRLVGSVPLSTEEAASRRDEWEKTRDELPPGLIGPTQLNLPANATREEKLLNDAIYARQRSFVSDIGCMFRGLVRLFSRQAWA